ncbi:MAG: hypothetical protein M1828_000691 [Chrysothrix sp. TS-e1954]|nr:MAG: hypothetical protein M1828_000691 [Chrysothrix sp. TS-e1954]
MSKFDPFNVLDVTYKTVDSVPIQASVVTSKKICPGAHPVIVHFHGGCLITGHRTYEEWTATWKLTLAERHNAIMIFPDYRLMPEANAADILKDLRDFYTWMVTSLPGVLSPSNIKPDLSNVLLMGESAGGYLIVQSALLRLYSHEITVKALVSSFGMLDMESKHFTEDYPKTIFGQPMLPVKALDDHIAAVKAGTVPPVVTSAVPPARQPFALLSLQHGKFYKLMGTEPWLFPMRNLDSAKHDDLVPMWIYHGRDDSAVPVENSTVFVDKVKKLHPQADIKLTLQPGDHGFDATMPLDTNWIQDGIDFIEKFWG